MSMNYTTIEQSKKLVELGVNPNTADMCYIQHFDESYDEVTFIEEIPIVASADAIDLPCWSLGALLEMMPEQLTYSDFKPFPLGLFKGNKEEYSKYGYYWIQYFCTEHGGAYIQTNGHTPLEAAYNMVCWLLENGYIKKGTLEGVGKKDVEHHFPELKENERDYENK